MSQFGKLNGQFLHMDLSSFLALQRYFRQFPKSGRQATAVMLNDLGFAARQQIPNVLHEHGLVMRSPKFAVSRMHVQKTTAKPIAEQRVVIGSVETKGKGGKISHDGWRSLQRGTRPDRNRTAALAARGGSFENKVRAKSRLKPDVEYPKPEDFDDVRGGINNRIQAMIREVATGAYSTGKMFILPKGQSGSFHPGLYRVIAKKKRIGKKVYPRIQIIQHFDREPQAKTFDWIGALVKTTIAKTDFRKAWDQAMQRVSERNKPK